MNRGGYVGFWIWNASSGAMRAAFYASWGLMSTLPAPSSTRSWLNTGYWWNMVYGFVVGGGQ